MAASTTGAPKAKPGSGKKPTASSAPPKGKKSAAVELSDEDLKKVSGGVMGDGSVRN